MAQQPDGGTDIPHSEFKIKEDDTTPAIEAKLTDANGLPVNLTGASVKFLMRVKPGGSVKVNTGAVIVGTATNGRVKYAWTAANTDTADVYEAEWEVTYSDSTIQTFPGGKEFITVTVGDQIA